MQTLRADKGHGENLSVEEGSLPCGTGLGRDQNGIGENVPTPSGRKGIRIKIRVGKSKGHNSFSLQSCFLSESGWMEGWQCYMHSPQ